MRTSHPKSLWTGQMRCGSFRLIRPALVITLAAFPEELIERILRFFSFRGQTVIDPFGGTGTVAAVSKRTGRHFIHIDHSDEYCSIARERTSKVQFGEDGRRGPVARVERGPVSRRRSRKTH